MFFELPEWRGRTGKQNLRPSLPPVAQRAKTEVTLRAMTPLAELSLALVTLLSLSLSGRHLSHFFCAALATLFPAMKKRPGASRSIASGVDEDDDIQIVGWADSVAAKPYI